MAPVIRIDDEVMAELKKRAVALNLVFEPPNSTLRSVLGLDLQAAFQPEAASPTAQAKPQTCDNRKEHVVQGRGGPTTRVYVRKAKERYSNRQSDREGFIAEVWNGIRDSAERSGKEQHVVEKATKAFLELLAESGHSPVTPRAIAEKAELSQTSSLLWPWLDRNAGVIRLETDESGKRRYSVPNDDDCVHLRKVVLGPTGS